MYLDECLIVINKKNTYNSYLNILILVQSNLPMWSPLLNSHPYLKGGPGWLNELSS